MSVSNTTEFGTLSTRRVGYRHYSLAECGGLDDTPAGEIDQEKLLSHLGREVLHGSRSRDFSSAYLTTRAGKTAPRMYRVESAQLGKCEYVMLTNKQYAAVLVVDIDRKGSRGGHPANLNGEVRSKFAKLIDRNLGPSWVGINPVSGHAQAVWLIDPVYAGPSGQSKQMKLLAVATQVLGEMLGHDPHFSHRFSRSPFYTGNNPDAYHWYAQHHRVYRLSELVERVRNVEGLKQHVTAPQQFSSGRELLETVKARRAEAEMFKSLSDSVEDDLGTTLAANDPDLVEGVRVIWIGPGHAARDETAFRHALKAGHRLYRDGKTMKDARIIDAYEHAYKVAHKVGAADRPDDMPPQRDRLTMARRVRGYVLSGKKDFYPGASEQATGRERKALQTLGRKGGQKAAERWKTDPQGEYAQIERKKLETANKRRSIQGANTRGRILHTFTETFVDTGRFPKATEVAEELGVEKRTVYRHLKALRGAGLLPEN